MEIDKIFNGGVDSIADNIFGTVNNSVSEVREMQKKKVAENVQLVIQALKKIESDLREQFGSVSGSLEKRILSIKDGKDGINGRDGKPGRDGKDGKDGKDGRPGRDGLPGRPGADGRDGVGVLGARIDFDGALVITLTSGQEINVGEVVAPDLAESIKVITNGGGTSQSVLDTLASLQAQISAIASLGAVSYQGTWNASTNTPTITSGSGTKGYYYVVSVAGTTSIDSEAKWGVGDWIVFNGTSWQKVDGGDTGDFTNLNVSGITNLSGQLASSVMFTNASKNISTDSSFSYDATNGRLGIGTSSPGAKLEVNAGANTDIRVNTSASGYLQLGQFTNGAFIGTSSSDATAGVLRFGTGGTAQMRLDTAGNLGLGVTPSAWGSPFKAFQLGVGGSLSGQTDNYTTTQMSSNAYYSSGWKYIAATSASQYAQSSGQHIWNIAAAGTAGAAISFTQAMTLDASGNLLVGATSSTTTARGVFQNAGNNVIYLKNTAAGGYNLITSAQSNGGTYYQVSFEENGTQRGSITSNGSTTAYNTTSDYRLKNVIGAVSGAGERIDALKPVDYVWKENGSKTRGFLAHEFQEVYAGSVTGIKDAVDNEGNPVYQQMQASTAEVIADLVAELQSLRKRVAQLEGK